MKRMRTLLLHLPLTAPGPLASYGQAWVDTAAPGRLQVQQAPLALLPATERRTPVVGIVPGAALSWHRVTLPPGLPRQGQRLLAALHGLLEDRLLQEAAQVHLALPPQWKTGEPLWVAACDRQWLGAHLQALQAAGLAVQRLVPEFSPPRDGPRWHALGDPDSGWLWGCSPTAGVCGWPASAAGQVPAAWLEGAPVLAEPGLAPWAQDRHPQQVQLVDSASHWLDALSSNWNLAQFDLAGQLRQQGWMRWRQGLDALWRQAAWRPARWGLLALLLAQLFGLQAWAWMTRQHWQTQQADWTRMLQEQFPAVTVVVDAPLQMAREVARLRQASGQLAAGDFESLLRALGTALPAEVASPSSLSYEQGVLQWPALALSATQKAALEQALARQGLQLHTQGEVWRLHSPEARP